MPRSIAEVNVIRQSNDGSAETSSPEHPSSAGHGRHGFDPNQPRVPAGHSDGGQWTEAGGYGPPSRREVEVDETGEEAWESVTNAYRTDGTLAEQGVINRDGSRIHSQFSLDPRMAGWDERHTVTLPDGQQVTFEQSGDVQRTYDADGRPIGTAVWTNEGPEALAQVQPAFLAAIPPAVATTVELALILATWLAGRKGLDGAVVVSFPADVYRPPRPDEKQEPVLVARLTEDELEKACKKYVNVQKFTNNAAANARREREDWSRSGFGTEVHKRVARDVNGKVAGTNEFRSPDDPEDPNFVAEFSAWKTKAADPAAQKPRYGQKGTIRVDVLENRKDNTVCVYDIKTGERGLLPGRIKEIVQSTLNHYPNAVRIIVTEIRPRL